MDFITEEKDSNDYWCNKKIFSHSFIMKDEKLYIKITDNFHSIMVVSDGQICVEAFKFAQKRLLPFSGILDSYLMAMYYDDIGSLSSFDITFDKMFFNRNHEVIIKFINSFLWDKYGNRVFFSLSREPITDIFRAVVSKKLDGFGDIDAAFSVSIKKN